jgi:hypothetical protein
VFDLPTAVDACAGTNVTITELNTVTNGSGCFLVITRTWQASDPCTNNATCSQVVTVQGVCTAPAISNSVFLGTSFSFDFVSESGFTYDVEYKDALSDASWTGLQSVAGTGAIITVADSSIPTGARFYRVVCRGQ